MKIKWNKFKTSKLFYKIREIKFSKKFKIKFCVKKKLKNIFINIEMKICWKKLKKRKVVK